MDGEKTGKSRKGSGTKPSLAMETIFWQKNYDFVFGVDEAGRGCLAGPVFAAVLAWPKNSKEENIPSGIRDSKKLSLEQRENLFSRIQDSTAIYGIGSATSQEIDRWNILEATSLAVARAVKEALEKIESALLRANLPTRMEIPALSYLADGKLSLVGRAKFFVYHPEYRKEFFLLQKYFQKQIREECLVKGDDLSFSIAAASILAKVSRDRYMENMHDEFPGYDFKSHKGYGTADHRQAIMKFGPCKIHRQSFAPIRELVSPELPFI